MKCREVKDLLVPYLDWEVNEKEKGVIAEHLSRCKGCREEMEDLAFIQRKVTYALKAAVEERDCPDRVWAGIQQRLMDKETPDVPALSLASRIARSVATLKEKMSGQPIWKTAVAGVLAVALIVGVALALPSFTGQRPLALALDPELMAAIYFEGISPTLQESLQRAERPVEISPETKRRILQAVPEGSEIGYVIEVNGTYHAMVMIEKGLEYVILAEVIIEGDKAKVVVFKPIPARLLLEPAFVEEEAGGAISRPPELGEEFEDIPPELEERILREVPGVTEIFAAGILDHTYRALVKIEDNGEARIVVVFLDGDKVEVTDLEQLLEKVAQWQLRREVLSVTLVEEATRDIPIPIPPEAQERMLQEVGGEEIIFGITFNNIHRAVVRIDENGKPKYVQVILMGDKLEIGIAEVEYVEYIEPHR